MMNRSNLFRYRPLPVLAAFFLLSSSLLSRAGEDAVPPQANGEKAPKFVRIGRPNDNTTELQIASVRYDPAEKGKPVVWLVGVVHVGDAVYYKKVQELLDTHEIVLFEGVGGPKKPAETAEKPAEEKPEVEKPVEKPAKPKAEQPSLQRDLAHAMGLEFQLDAIDYKRKNFKNCDLHVDQIRELLTEEDKSSKDAIIKPSAQFDTLMGMLSGGSLLGKLAGFALSLVKTSPKMQATFKLTMVETLGQSGGDVAGMQKGTQLEKLFKVIIDKRNEAVMKGLMAELEKPEPSKSIAVFYGAGHMVDLDRKLRETLHYKVGEEQWHTAFGVDAAKAGMTGAELNMVRSMVSKQMDMLSSKAKTPPAAKPPATAPQTQQPAPVPPAAAPDK